MADGLNAALEEAQEGTDEINTAEPQAFVKNVVWLIDSLHDNSGDPAARAIREARDKE